MSDSPENLLLYRGLLQSTTHLFEVCIFIAKQISFNVLTSTPLPFFVLQSKTINCTWGLWKQPQHTQVVAHCLRAHLSWFSFRTAGGGHWRRKKSEYKYVEWKLCEANPSCVHCSHGTVDYKPKKVVLLCIHVLKKNNLLVCISFLFFPPYSQNSMLQLTCQRQFHLLCLNAFINASQTHNWWEPHAKKKVCH